VSTFRDGPATLEPDHLDAIVEQWSRERPDLDATPLGVIGRICRLAPQLTDAQAATLRPLDLDAGEYDVLASLRRSGTPYETTPGELARALLVTPGAIAQRLARLEDRGLVERRHDNPDRRKVTVALTPSGRTLIDQAVPAHLATARRLLAPLDDHERQTLSDLLRRVLASQESCALGGAEAALAGGVGDDDAP